MRIPGRGHVVQGGTLYAGRKASCFVRARDHANTGTDATDAVPQQRADAAPDAAHTIADARADKCAHTLADTRAHGRTHAVADARAHASDAAAHAIADTVAGTIADAVVRTIADTVTHTVADSVAHAFAGTVAGSIAGTVDRATADTAASIVAGIVACAITDTATRIIAYTVPQNQASWGLMIGLAMRRREDMDFDHPAFPTGHPLSRHIVYALEVRA